MRGLMATRGWYPVYGKAIKQMNLIPPGNEGIMLVYSVTLSCFIVLLHSTVLTSQWALYQFADSLQIHNISCRNCLLFMEGGGGGGGTIKVRPAKDFTRAPVNILWPVPTEQTTGTKHIAWGVLYVTTVGTNGAAWRRISVSPIINIRSYISRTGVPYFWYFMENAITCTRCLTQKST